jgi:hypothetical protein
MSPLTRLNGNLKWLVIIAGGAMTIFALADRTMEPRIRSIAKEEVKYHEAHAERLIMRQLDNIQEEQKEQGQRVEYLYRRAIED